jgi:predicted ATPase
VEQHEERWWEAEVCRLRGVLLLRQPETPQAEAEAWVQRALDVARRQEAKALELRAAMSLARLWQQQGKPTEARELLAPIYSWFTEGFDTADLQEAKVLNSHKIYYHIKVSRQRPLYPLLLCLHLSIHVTAQGRISA